MTKTIDYYYTHTSPWTYLGHDRFLKIAAAAGATVNFKPASMEVIFPQSGGLPLPKRAPQRQAYRMMELRRWHDFLGIPITFEPKFFPTASTPAGHMAVAAGQAGLDMGKLSGAILRAVWVEERDIADDDTLVAIANEQGFDGPALLAKSKGDDAKAGFEANTAEAMQRNVFGAPTYIYKDENFWGQDRLDFVERALARG
jgi:2-hydroxychromene-2-carboxylate isomerase